VLLFSAGDVVKQTGFIDEKPDPREQAIARAQLQADGPLRGILRLPPPRIAGYFGERYSSGRAARGAIIASRLARPSMALSLRRNSFPACIAIRERARFGVGLNHVIEVLTGADTEKIRRWGHEQLSTYGIGKEHTRPEWGAIGRELIRLGHLRQTAEKFSNIGTDRRGSGRAKRSADA